MKTKLIRSFILIMTIVVIVPNFALAQVKTKTKSKIEKTVSKNVWLFNGKDLKNWVFKLKDPSVDPSTVFSVRDGVIHISGDPFGYMRTKDTYSEYRLHVEWRWPSEASNSGVFVHAQLPDSIWLKCIECQLQAGNAGDFVCMNGADMKERIDKKNVFVKKLTASSEKPVGEWNIMEILCTGNTIEVTVNGILQNKGSDVSVNTGNICLQSEGKDIEFRKVYLNKLRK
jgi:hypothetical protein